MARAAVAVANTMVAVANTMAANIMGTVMGMGTIMGMVMAGVGGMVAMGLWRRLMLAMDPRWLYLDLRLLSSGQRGAVGFGRRPFSQPEALITFLYRWASLPLVSLWPCAPC